MDNTSLIVRFSSKYPTEKQHQLTQGAAIFDHMIYLQPITGLHFRADFKRKEDPRVSDRVKIPGDF